MFTQQPAASKTEVKKTAIKQTNAASGKEMFVQYRASCHGTDGKGNGPPAPAMKVHKYHDGVVQQRIASIVGYIETLQAR